MSEYLVVEVEIFNFIYWLSKKSPMAVSGSEERLDARHGTKLEYVSMRTRLTHCPLTNAIKLG
jgi:hypothetical protein